MSESVQDASALDLSIVIPVWNTTESDVLSARFLSRVARADITCEVVVVDDASTDSRTESLCDALVGMPCVRVLRLDHNLGPGGARNAGVVAARGRWVAFIDADDSCDLEALLMAAALADRHECDIVALDYLWSELGVSKLIVSSTQPQPNLLQLIRRRPAVWRMIFSRDFLHRVPPFPHFRYGEDLAFLLEAAAVNPRVYYLAGMWAVTYRSPSPPRYPDFGDRAALLDFLGRLRSAHREPQVRAVIDSWATRVIALGIRHRPITGLKLVRHYPWPGLRESARAAKLALRARGE